MQAGAPDSRRCIVCDRAEPFPTFYERGEFRLVRCPGCSLVFQHPQPSRAAMARLYYHDEEFTRMLEGELRPTTVALAESKFELLAGAGVHPPGSALDVGASTGAWVQRAAQAGWDAVGVELGDASASAARARGLDVRTGTLEQAAPALAGRRFDLITFWDVLEHVPDPLAELERAGAMLADGGVLAVTLPNVDGWYPRVTRQLLARRTGVWEYPELPAHLFDFAPSTLRALTARAGLVVQRIHTVPTPFTYYRATSLHYQLAGRGVRGRALRVAFELLRAGAYPAARAFDRSNSLFATFTAAAGSPPTARPDAV